jgi:hypothetical protein
MTIAMIVATLFSPLVAVLVTLWLQSRKEKRDAKRWIFTTLIGSRHRPLADETVRALNMIDVTFHDSAKVRRLWREYFDSLGNTGLQSVEGFKQRQVKNLEMISAMAAELGYGKTVSQIDVDRVYYPIGLGKQVDRSEELADELLRVLKGTQGFVLAAKQEVPPLVGAPTPPRSSNGDK